MQYGGTHPLRLRRGQACLVAGALVAGIALPVSLARAGSGTISVVDYSQCANGASGTSCSGGWINGVLQSSNSHYKETDVTPQRLVVKAAAGLHSVTLSYLARKGDSVTGTHAYDGLATWNKTTATPADRCLGLTNPVKADLSCSSTEPTSWLAIPGDGNRVNPIGGSSYSNITSEHVPAGRFELFGPLGTAFTTVSPSYSHSNSNSSGDGSGDDYVTLTINWTQVLSGNVQIMFGGHLAASPLNPIGGEHGWGPFLGASNINGGPYHIKWALADGVSVGSRDNQIMGGSVQSLASTTISTTSSPNVTLASGMSTITVSDTATVSIGSTSGVAPTGAVTFKLYGPLTQAPSKTSVPSDCRDTAFDADHPANLLATVTDATSLTALAPYRSVGTTTLATPTPGYYAWVASYPGDSNNMGVSGACGDANESFQVIKATPGGSVAQRVGAQVAVTGYGSPTGTVDFRLYDNSACSNADATHKLVFSELGVQDAVTTGDTADGIWVTAGEFGAESGKTYYWKITYDPGSTDVYNNAGDVVACGGKTFLAS